jgi:hypothetical protein
MIMLIVSRGQYRRERAFPTRLLTDQLFWSCSHSVRKEELANASLPFRDVLSGDDEYEKHGFCSWNQY